MSWLWGMQHAHMASIGEIAKCSKLDVCNNAMQLANKECFLLLTEILIRSRDRIIEVLQ